jgi:hypothetical protein
MIWPTITSASGKFTISSIPDRDDRFSRFRSESVDPEQLYSSPGMIVIRV